MTTDATTAPRTMKDCFVAGTTNGAVAARKTSVSLTAQGHWAWEAWNGGAEPIATGVAETYWEARWSSLQPRVEAIITKGTRFVHTDVQKEYIADHVRDAVMACIRTPEDGQDKSDWWLLNRARGYMVAYSGHQMRAAEKTSVVTMEVVTDRHSGVTNRGGEYTPGAADKGLIEFSASMNTGDICTNVDIQEALKYLSEIDIGIVRMRLDGYTFTYIMAHYSMTHNELRGRLHSMRAVFDAAVRAE